MEWLISGGIMVIKNVVIGKIKVYMKVIEISDKKKYYILKV